MMPPPRSCCASWLQGDVTPEAVQAVRELIHLCRLAVRDRLGCCAYLVSLSEAPPVFTP